MAHSAVMPFRLTVLLIGVGVLAGCGTRTKSPLERASSLFANAEFTQALKVCDDALAVTDDPKEAAKLQQLRGRCFIEQAHRLQLGNQQEAAEAKLNQAIDALTRSLESEENPKALYCRSMAYRMLGDEQRSSVDERRAHEIDPEYQMAWTNEPQEPPIDLDLTLESSGVEELESESSTQPSSGASTVADSDANSTEGLFGADEELAADDVTSTRLSETSPMSASDSNPVNRQNSSPRQAPEYRGQPASPGSLSIARSASEFGRTPWRAGQAGAEETSATEADDTADDGDSDASLEEGDATDQDSTGTPSDSEGESSSQQPTRPRPNVIWSPAIAPWSSPSPSTAPMTPPTTGIGGGYMGTPVPFSPILNPAAPTTGLGGAPMRMPWQNLAGGATANPFAPPTPFGPGIPLPQAVPANPPRMPQAPMPPAMPGPANWPQQPVGAPVPPTFGPGPTPQALPSTGVQRTVSPFQQ